jgi:glycine cleavage system regulatory protein
MTTLVLTIVGDDRAGLVASVADIVRSHGGNWENSQLAELSGAFAGIVEISVPADRADEMREALSVLDGLLTIGIHAGDGEARDAAPARRLTITVLGNDHPGIVRDVTSVFSSHGISIDRMTTETRDAAMSGGRLFEATVAASVPDSVDLAAVEEELQRLAAEIQLDVTIED